MTVAQTSSKCLKRICSVFLLTLIGATAQADSLGALQNLNAAQFEELTENLGAATHDKGVTPAEALGVVGLDLGLGLAHTDIDEALFDLGSEGEFDGSGFNLARLHLHKGLPFGLDVGASIARGIDNDATVLGAEIRYNLVDGGVVSPSLALRGSYSRVLGFDELDLSNAALELTVSKGFLLLTPYAGIGMVRTTADPDESTGLAEQEVDMQKLYLGLTLNLGLAITLEADQTGDLTSYSAKAGIRF